MYTFWKTIRTRSFGWVPPKTDLKINNLSADHLFERQTPGNISLGSKKWNGKNTQVCESCCYGNWSSPSLRMSGRIHRTLRATLQPLPPPKGKKIWAIYPPTPVGHRSRTAPRAEILYHFWPALYPRLVPPTKTEETEMQKGTHSTCYNYRWCMTS